VREAEPFMEPMCADVDSLEFRADLLDCANSKNGGNYNRFEILHQQQLLRHMCRNYAKRAPALQEYQTNVVMDNALPIVYTVRTAHQAGTWPDQTDQDIQRMMELLELGLRTSVEVLDVESAWDKDLTHALLDEARTNYAPTSILGSHHVVHKAVTNQEAISIYQTCTLEGKAEGAKVVLSMGTNDDGEDVQDSQAWDTALEANLDVPFIALMLGQKGQYSRILNQGFTPVTHEALPFVAAPGQLSANEIMATRLIMNEQIQPTKYGILGHQISYSVSPAMHNTAFQITNLPHTYELVDQQSVQDIVNDKDGLWNAPNFGGCSVTIPHKQTIIPHLNELTPAARDIGAVNTVLVRNNKNDDNESSASASGERYLVGDNTDWKGIYTPLQRRLSSTGGYALILGGGGTARAAAYAANQLGLTCLYFNRTPSKAQDLQQAFGGQVLTSLDNNNDSPDSLFSLLNTNDDDNKQELSVIVSTLPASVEFTLPLWLTRRNSKNKIVVLDVNYKPYWTALSTQLKTMEDQFDIVRGSEMLWEQGIGQFEAWTQRTAPYGVMKRVVLDNCLPKEEETTADE
jgi:pentafunctional AROM polypeptide